MSEEQLTRTASPASTGAGDAVARVVDRIGPYTLLRPLGEGGMGVVYLAEQKTPVERRVALKVIKFGMDTREVVTRFEAERQALAVMDHPGIARVFDGGATDAGRPFFVMELVEGQPITQFCDHERLSIRDRISLVIDVCRAVQHAHQKGIIHRDLKPSNVLVTMQDGRPAAKVIDFGIAKATQTPLTDRTFATQAGQVVGTPAYMSPEQLGLVDQDIDTRADIYSLGVLLYELLAGVRPFEHMELGTGLSLIDAIRNSETPKLSTRVTSVSAERQGAIAAARKTDPVALRRTLRGDLDWIVLKAIDKDRSRRYDTANTLAGDLHRYLGHEPVSARPPSTTYRVRKFVTRHRVGVAAGAAMLALIVGSAGVIAVQAARVATERDRAAREAAKATSINEFLQQMLASANPQDTGSRTMTVVDALAGAERRVESSLSTQPDVAGAVRRTLGQSYFGLGEYDRAQRILTAAVTGSRSSGRRQDLALDLAELGSVLRQSGKLEEAARLQREAVDTATSGGVAREVKAHAQYRLANTLQGQGQYDEARRLATEALQTRTAVFGPESREVAESYHQLALIASDKGEADTADDFMQRAIDLLRKKLGPRHQTVGTALNDSATFLIARSQFEKALPILEEVLAIGRADLGDNHPEVAVFNENLANVLYRLNRATEAAARLEEVLAVRRATLGDDSMVVARTLQNMGVVYINLKDFDKAQLRLNEARERLQRALGPEHPETGTVLRNIGVLRQNRGDQAGAESALRQALAIHTKALGETHLQTALSSNRLGQVLTAQKKYAEAETMLLRARNIRVAALGPTAQPTRAVEQDLIKLYDAWEKPEKAKALEVAEGKR
jgi:eukaryotic-like serine/threonine-protein kinase